MAPSSQINPKAGSSDGVHRLLRQYAVLAGLLEIALPVVAQEHEIALARIVFRDAAAVSVLWRGKRADSPPPASSLLAVPRSAHDRDWAEVPLVVEELAHKYFPSGDTTLPPFLFDLYCNNAAARWPDEKEVKRDLLRAVVASLPTAAAAKRRSGNLDETRDCITLPEISHGVQSLIWTTAPGPTIEIGEMNCWANSGPSSGLLECRIDVPLVVPVLPASARFEAQARSTLVPQHRSVVVCTDTIESLERRRRRRPSSASQQSGVEVAMGGEGDDGHDSPPSGGLLHRLRRKSFLRKP
ncbi:hypothetical protein JCM10908_004206 [Rhodotorula pacifica]|uniref:uncharacterized protein n=1 Tax=Rhodotorula pacifica TaxID=1495444 RepID=UPI00317BE6B9